MPTRLEELMDVLLVPPRKKIDLVKDYDPGFTGDWVSKKEAAVIMAQGIQQLAAFQDKLYAQDTYGLLIILQALDAAGKDGTIKHVLSGVNPQGTQVYSFKAPSGEELDHDYLWRNFLALPRRGNIGIFNRSYYEEVLIVRVHPQILASQHLPPELKGGDIWKRRFEEINNFEKYLVNNGIVVLKFFLNVSKDEQRKRFLERVDLPEKNWKFSGPDLKERQYWDQYMAAYEDVFNHTSTEWAPWHIVPADNKWFTRLAVAATIYQALDKLNLAYPVLSDQAKEELAAAKAALMSEAGGREAEEQIERKEAAQEGKKPEAAPKGKKTGKKTDKKK
jgi:PPK2 family polyphosphate:nucleotide phosphotransferase